MDLTNCNLGSDGLVIIKNCFSESKIVGLRESLDRATKKYNELQCSKGLDSLVNGTLHHPLLFDDAFLGLLDMPESLHHMVEGWFKGNYILNSYGGVTNVNKTSSYVQAIHRDTRFYCGEYNLFLNLLLPLDDFTIENGATYILNKKWSTPTCPDKEFFLEHADRLLVNAGDAVLFDSNLWHKAGNNTTSKARRCVTMTFSRPWIKPQFDFCAAVAMRMEVPTHLRQILGYFSRVPASANEWLLPANERFYRQGQDKVASDDIGI